MLEAIVGVALRAILASVLFGAVLSGLVLLATRRLALTAATRHALWTTAMIATAVMPLAGVAVSLARATPVETPAAVTSPAVTASSSRHAQWPADRALPIRTSATGTSAVTTSSTTAAPPPSSSLLRTVPLALASWTPQVTRALALGVVAVWSLGALAGIIGLFAGVLRIRGLKRRSSPLDATLADELPWLTATGPGREIYLRLSYEIETPVAIGFGRPVILIPTELTGDGGLAALEPLVLHEHAHLRRYDDWTNLIQRTIERVFWFNPIVWLVGRRIALEREIASDDAVVERTGEAHAYATSLWKLAREMRMPEHAVVAPGALLTRKQIAVRIEELLDANRNRRRPSPAAALGTALAGIVAVAFVATSAPAVELPVTTAPVPATQIAAKTPSQSVTKRTVASSAAPQHTIASPGAARQARTARVAAPAPRKVATTTSVTTTTKTATRIVYKYVEVPAKTGGVPRVPSVPAVPLVPAVPGVPPMPPMPHVAPSLSPHAAAAIRAAGSSASAAIAFGTALGSEIGGSVGHALAHLPREIAQIDESERQQHHTLPAGSKPTRELLAGCTGCSLHNADLRGIDLHGLTLRGDEFDGADLRGANLAGAKLFGVSLRGANLGNADLRGAQLNGVELRGASLAGARIDDINLIGVSLRSPGVSGVPLRSLIADCTGCDLAQLDLHGMDLHGLSLVGTDLSGANLSGANLSAVRFTGVDLSHANLAGADLTNAHFTGCDLHGVALHGAVTTGMKLSGASLDE
ncbi:MAG TPA: pentapeptide repeat-containing protein [Candidatus Elarobacter sp.]|jgi:uncharacterized protein YjbI with pentapeptide repeats/beta-lactamase regulating signal transducer with metallopeptidase domain|nr:pentapeptide repeat-containing protein [Candidatus Elarobacter sp.]